MVVPADFVPARLVLARERVGLTQRQLADLCGLSERIIKAYEAGTSTPSLSSLEQIATATEFPAPFFTKLGGESIAPDAVSFRSFSRASARLKRRAIAAGGLALDLHRYLADQFTLPAVDLPDMRHATPESAAVTVRQRWGIGERPISNVVHFLESKGVRVFSLAEDCAAIDAFSCWRDGEPFVFLNTRKTAERSLFDAAHELGHLVLHQHQASHGPDAEREADAFAGAFLMPEHAMRATVPQFVSVATLTTMKRTWRTSVAAIAYRLRSLGLLSEWRHKSICIELSRRGRENEPDPIARERSTVLAQTLSALEEDGLTLRGVARELSLPVRELRALTFGLTSIEGSRDSSLVPSAERPSPLQLVR